MAPERATSGVVEPPALVIEVPLFRARRGFRLGFRTEGQSVPEASNSTAARNLILAHRWCQALAVMAGKPGIISESNRGGNRR